MFGAKGGGGGGASSPSARFSWRCFGAGEGTTTTVYLLTLVFSEPLSGDAFFSTIPHLTPSVLQIHDFYLLPFESYKLCDEFSC
jgi:hypothetical protein